MSFKIVFLAVALFGYQVNAQGIIRPFATGFTNGFAEMAKPFVQFGQSVMAPASEYMANQRFPYVSQMMTYPSKIVPQAQGAPYEGFEAISSAMPGAGYFQAVRPSVMKPQPQYYQIPSQSSFPKPPRPFPSTFEESVEMYRPSNLLIKPETEIPKPDVKLPLDEGFAGPSAQIEDKE